MQNIGFKPRTVIISMAFITIGAVSARTNPVNPSVDATNKTRVTRYPATVLLDGKSIPGKGFIHLYDSIDSPL